MKDAVLVVRRAEISHSCMQLASDPLRERGGQSGFADAGLARDQCHSTFARFRLIPPTQENLDLLIAPHKWRRPGTQGLEATYNPAFAGYAPRPLRFTKSGERSWPKILNFE